MESYGHRHWLCAEVGDLCMHLKNTILQAMRDFNGVSERELLHPHRLLEEFQTAGHPSGFPIGFDFNHLPLICTRKKTVYRDSTAHVAKIHIERVSLAVRVERLFVQAVRPRAKKWNTAQCGSRLEFFD